MGTTYNRTRQKKKRQFLRGHMTLAEKTLWYNLKARQMCGYKFRRQHGIKEYVVDFYCPELKLAIEADGESHESKEAKEYDNRRQREIESKGIRFLRFTDDEIVGNPDLVVKRIEREIERLSLSKGSPTD